MKSSSSLPGGGLLSALILLALLLAATAAPAQDALSLGHASGPPGTVVALPLTLDGGAEALQLDLLFDPVHLVFEGVVAGSGLAGRVLDWSEVAPGQVRLVVYWLTCTSQRSSGQGLASLQLRISPQATPGLEWVELADVVLADSEAGLIAPVTLADGSVEILGEPGEGDLPPSLIEIPTLGQIGLVFLSLLMALAACLALRRFGAAMVVALLLGSAALVTASLAASSHALESRSGAFDIEAIESIADAILGRAAETPEMDCNQDGVVDARDLVCALNDFCDTEVGDNQPPVMEPIADRMVEAGQTLLVQVEASDPDPGDVLSFDLPQGPTGMAIDPSSGLITWVTTADDLGQHPVTARVTDSGGLTDSQSFQVTVAEVAANQPPSLSAIADRSLLAGQVLSVQPEATDPDLPDDVLTFSLSSRPSGMSLNAATGSILWVPTEGQVGDHGLTLIVTDAGGLSDATAFTVTVSTVGSPPTLQPIPNQELVLGDSLALTAQASDPDLPNDVLTFSLPLAPAGMSIHAASGSIVWTPGSGQVGLHDVTVQVTDQVGLLDVTTFTVTVRDVNRAPVARDDEYITPKGETSTIDAPGVLENDSDPDGDPITAELVSEPNRGVLDFRADGSFDYTPGPVLSQFEAELVTDFRTLTIDGDSATWRVNRGTVVAADLTGNGRSELVSIGQRGVTAQNTQYLTAVAFNEDDELELLWFWNGWRGANPVDDPDRDFAMREARDPVIGDLYGDGVPEIVVTGYCRGDILIFSNSGERLVSTQAGRVPEISETSPECPEFYGSGTTADRGRLSLVDLSGDGLPEILLSTRNELRVFDGAGQLLWEAQAPNFGPGGAEFDYAVADVNLDGQPQIWFGGALFDADGNVLWAKATNPLSSDWIGWYAVANLNDDPFGELIFWGVGPDLIVFDHHGDCLWQARKSSSTNPAPTLGCPTAIQIPDLPTLSPGFRSGLMVGDIAGDGVTRIVIGNRTNSDGELRNRVIAFDPDGTPFWSVPALLSSGASVRVNQINGFDFTGNGAMELVVTGVNGTVVLDGRDGSTLFEIPADDDNPGFGTSTGQDIVYSIIVDLDGDGAAELVVSSQGSAGLSGETATGLFVYRDPQNRWMPTRGIWNQWAYSITNVNADASIPSPAERNWLTAGLNNYRVNQPMPGEPGAFDRFTYRAFDGELHSNEATVYLDIRRPNRPPVILSSPPIIVGAGFDYRYQVHAFDSDPGDIVTVALEHGPPGMILDSDDIVRWAPTMADLGTNEVLVSARDTENAFALQEYVLEVVEAQPVPNVVGQPLADAQAAITAASFVVGTVTDTDHPTVPAGSVAGQSPPGGAHEAPGTAVRLAVSTGPGPGDIDADGDGFTPNQGDCDDTNPDIYPGAPDPFGDGIDWNCNGIDGDRPVVAIVIEPEPLDLLQGEQVQLIAHGIFDDGSAQLITGAVDWGVTGTAATISAGGLLTATSGGSATVTASRDGITGTLPVTVTEKDNDDDAGPIAEILNPQEGAIVNGAVDIVGTALDPNLVRYDLFLAPAGGESFSRLGGGTTSIANGALGTLDPTTLLNGFYHLRLTVLDAGGNQGIDEITVQIDGDQKVGLFTLSFTDLQIPLGGLPILLERVYDSRDRSMGDFGMGWRLALRSIEVTCGSTLGENWHVAKTGLSFSLLPTREKACALNLPGGRLEVFDFVPSVSSSPFVPFITLSGSLRPRSGTLGKLEILDNTNFLILDPQPGPVQLYDDSTFQVFNPRNFRYTMPDGTVFDFVDGRVTKVTEPNGNSLAFSVDGIEHSSGIGVSFERDGQGRITAVTDPSGNTQTYAYSANSDLASHTDALGNATRFFYNSRHGLVRIEDPLGNNAIRSEYDERNRLIAVVDAAGNRTEHAYDDVARLKTTSFPDGSTRVVSYDERGNIETQTHLVTIDGTPVFSEQTWEYDELGNPTRVVDPDGVVEESDWNDDREWTRRVIDPGGLELVEEQEFDLGGRLSRSVDALGRERQYQYDSRNNVTFSPGPGGMDFSLSYDSGGRLGTLGDPRGDLTRLEYNGAGQVIAREVRSPGGLLLSRVAYQLDLNGRIIAQTEVGLVAGETSRTTTLTRDPMGRVLSVTNSLSETTAFEYDANSNVTAIIDPLGARTEMNYDERGLMVERRLADGGVETYDYDHAGRRLRHVDPDGVLRETEYDELGRAVAERVDGQIIGRRIYSPGGRLVAEVDALGHRTDYEYDSAGRMVRTLLPEVFDALSGSTARPEVLMEYNALGQRTAMVDPLGRRTEYAYDDAGSLNRVIHPDGSERQHVFDPAGRHLSVTDEEGHSTLFEYDAAGRLIRVLQPAPAPGEPRPETLHSYDSFGQLRSQIDALGRVTAFEYDAAGRRIHKIMPDGTARDFEYDAVGRQIRITDFDGTQLHFSHDALGRLLSRTGPGAVESISYTAAGRRASVNDSRGVTTFAHDHRGRLAAIAEPDGLGIEYEYDANGRVVALTVAGETTTYTWDALGRLESVTTSEGTVNHTYDLAGQLVTRTLPNGLLKEVDYDLRGRRLEVAWRDPANALLERFALAYSPRGQRTSVTQLDGSVETYAYDPIGRLIAAQRSGSDPFDILFEYDPVGNRLRQVLDGVETLYSYGPNHELLTAGADAFSYDGRGNRVAGVIDNDAVGYQWDAFGRLVGAVTPDGQAEFEYDIDNRRVARHFGGQTHRMLIDPQSVSGFDQVVVERDDGGSVQARMHYGHGLLMQERAGQIRHHLSDHRGSVRMLADTVGNVTDRYDYLPFGDIHRISGSSTNPYRFNSERYESNARAYDMRARSYDSCSGTFLSRDPFPGFQDRPISLHPYQFGDADPVNHIDPLGLFTLIELNVTSFIQATLRMIPAVKTMCTAKTKIAIVEKIVGITNLTIFFAALPFDNRELGLSARVIKLGGDAEISFEVSGGLKTSGRGALGFFGNDPTFKAAFDDGRGVSGSFEITWTLDGPEINVVGEMDLVKLQVCDKIDIGAISLVVDNQLYSPNSDPEVSIFFKLKFGTENSIFDSGGIETPRFELIRWFNWLRNY